MKNIKPLEVTVAVVLFLNFVTWSLAQDGIVNLPRHFRIKKELITMSGFSSGGTFAQQVYISHSSLIHGIAVFSHAYYRCGPVTTNERDYDDACTLLGNGTKQWDADRVFTDIENYFSRALIDNPKNLLNKPLYVYTGTRSFLFSVDTSLKIVQVFEPFIRNPKAIRTVVQDANFTFPTNRADQPPCNGPTNNLRLSNCGFSGPHDALEFLLGSDHVREPTVSTSLQPLLSFNQTEFFSGVNGRIDMDAVGYIYIPKMCRDNRLECLLHFYFHGCWTGREFVGEDHIRNSGYLEVAETHGIIMIFPQVMSSAGNEIGRWDTYGFTGPLYATRAGAQVTVIRNMLSRLLGESRRSSLPNSFRFFSQTEGRNSDAQSTSSNLFTQFIESNANVFRF